MRRWWRRAAVAPLVGAVVLVLVCAAGVRAETAPRNLFEVRNVKVDVVATTASQAREQALADAENRAFQMLLDRLTPARDQLQPRRFAPAEIASATKDFWVSEEKVSPVRYLATLNYEFRAERVRELAAAKGLSLVTLVAQPVIIVPVLDEPTGARLWPPGNPWWDAVAGLPADGLVPVVIPKGDADDAQRIDAKAALAVDELRLAALARRYDVLDILVAIARRGTGGALTVVTKRKLTFGPVSETTAQFRAEGAESEQDLLKRAAAAMLKDIENAWKESTRGESAASSGVIAVDVPVRDLKTWLLVEKSLNRIPGVRRVDPVMFSPGRVRVNVAHSGSAEEVATALERAGFAVTQAGGFWIVRPVKALTPGPS